AGGIWAAPPRPGRPGGPARRNPPADARSVRPPAEKTPPGMAKKTLQQRERELQALLATPAGRKGLDEPGSRYRGASGKVRPRKASLITYLLVHERGKGLIVG